MWSYYYKSSVKSKWVVDFWPLCSFLRAMAGGEKPIGVNWSEWLVPNTYDPDTEIVLPWVEDAWEREVPK